MDRKTFITLLILATLCGGCAALGNEQGDAGSDAAPGGEATGSGASASAVAQAASENGESAAGADADAKPAPALIARLPETLESFDYAGYRYFEQSGAGFTVRYQNTRKKRSADVYVYPVAQENLSMEHSQLVMGSTRATLQAIGKAVSRGLYDNFNVVGAATHARGARTVARVQTTYLHENLASYSLLYQTEHEGTLVKIRINMPDNEYNRASAEWDRFALQVLDLVIGKERADMQAASGSV